MLQDFFAKMNQTALQETSKNQSTERYIIKEKHTRDIHGNINAGVAKYAVRYGLKIRWSYP